MIFDRTSITKLSLLISSCFRSITMFIRTTSTACRLKPAFQRIASLSGSGSHSAAPAAMLKVKYHSIWGNTSCFKLFLLI